MNMKLRTLLLTSIITLGITITSSSQVAPLDGKKVLKVVSSYDGEYDQEVYRSHLEAPYNYHMKRLPKKLGKYGFTNVVITSMGSVKGNAIAKSSRAKMSDAYATIDGGGSLNQAKRALDNNNTSKFQVNFSSDQGEYKVRLGMTMGIRYIIKE
jgi:hypothetical protein